MSAQEQVKHNIEESAAQARQEHDDVVLQSEESQDEPVAEKAPQPMSEIKSPAVNDADQQKLAELAAQIQQVETETEQAMQSVEANL